MDIRVIRYADVLLMASESALETGQDVLALEYMNMVRTRARNSGNTGVPVNLASLTFDDIVHERAVELAMEGHRFFDLMRWGLAWQHLNGLYVSGFDSTMVFETGIDEFFPKPAFIKGPLAPDLAEDKTKPEFNIFPVPAKNEIWIEYNGYLTYNTSIEIFDNSGKLVFTERLEEVPSLMHSIDFSRFMEGIYLMKITNAEFCTTRKFVKVK
jgi:hypothetical protein